MSPGSSAKEGFQQVTLKMGDYLTLVPLAEYYSNFGMFFVAMFSTLIGGVIMVIPGDFTNYQWIFIVLFFIFSMVIASIFMSAITMAANCCLFYVTFDKMVNSGHIVHGPPTLKDLDDCCK